MDARPDRSAEPNYPSEPNAHQGYAGPAADEPSFSPLNFLQVMRRYLWLWIPLTIAGGLGGYVYQSTRTPIHLASARVLVERRQSILPMDMMALLAGSNSPLEQTLLTHMEIIRSPAVLDGAAKDPRLANMATFTGRQPAPTILLGLDVRRPKFADNTVVPSVLEITYRCENKDEAPIILETVVKAYRDYVSRKEETDSSTALKRLAETTREIEEELKKLQDLHSKFCLKDENVEALAFRDARGEVQCLAREDLGRCEARIIDGERAEEQFRGKRQGWVDRLAKAKNDSKEYENVRAAIELEAGSHAVDLAEMQRHELTRNAQSQPASVQNRTSLIESLEVELKTLLQRYSSEAPEVKTIQVRLDALKATNKTEMVEFQQAMAEAASRAATDKPRKVTADIVASYLMTLDQSMQGVQELLKFDRKQAAKLKPIVKIVATVAQDDKDMRTKIAERKDRLLKLGLQHEARNLANKESGVFVEEIQPPTYRGDPTGAIVRAVLLGALLGFLAALAASYLLEMLDQNFRTPDDVRDVVGARVLGHIPDFSAKIRRLGRRHGVDPSLVVHLDRGDPASEAYRRLRTGIYFSQHHRKLEVLQVTSPVPGDGKTTLSCNLAVAIAQSGRKVLLVDADLRRPRVHRMFGVPNEVGLANVLSGTRRHEAEILALTHPTMVFREALAVVGRSRPAGNVRIVLAYPAMAEGDEPRLVAYGVQADDRMPAAERRVYRFEVDLRKPADEQPKLTPTLEKDTDRARFLRGLHPATVVEQERRIFAAAELHQHERVAEAAIRLRGGVASARLYALRGGQSVALDLDDGEVSAWDWRPADLFEDALMDLGDALPGLTIMAAGRTQRGNAAELLTDESFEAVVARARAEFDFVVIDTPPLLAVSDPAVVAPRADGVLLALSLHGQARRNAIDAVEALRHIKCDVVGSVINCKGGGSVSYGGRFYGRYSYQLGARGGYFNSGRTDSGADYAAYYRQYTKDERERKL